MKGRRAHGADWYWSWAWVRVQRGEEHLKPKPRLLYIIIIIIVVIITGIISASSYYVVHGASFWASYAGQTPVRRDAAPPRQQVKQICCATHSVHTSGPPVSEDSSGPPVVGKLGPCCSPRLVCRGQTAGLRVPFDVRPWMLPWRVGHAGHW